MRKRQAKILVASAVILGLALLLTGLSIRIIPQWENAPGGWLALLGAAILVIAGLGGKIKDWVELLFGGNENKNPGTAITQHENTSATAATAYPTQTSTAVNITQSSDTVVGIVVGEQRGNIDFHPTILLQARETSPASGAPPASSSPYFVARGPIMDELRQALQQGGRRAIVGVGGMGGVGKTELALHLAHEIEQARAGTVIWVLVANRPLEYVQSELASALGVTFPSNADAYLRRSVLWRAFQEQPKVVFFDDVRPGFEEGLEFCLPPSPPCAALVTSRQRQLRGLLPGEIRELGVMSENQAVTMLENWPEIGSAIQQEPQATRELVRACACHPLALSLAAARLKPWIRGRTQPIAAFVAQLEDRIAQLAIGKGPLESLEANFDLSLKELQDDERQRYLLLSAFAPSGFQLGLAAALWGNMDQPLDETRRALEHLQSLSLLEPGETADRWKLHDLLYEFTLKRLRQQGNEVQVMETLCDLMVALFDQFYTADRNTAPHVAYELDNLRRAAEWAIKHGDGLRLARLATTPCNWLYNFFRNFDEWEKWLLEALQLGFQDKQLEANTLKAIGDVQQFRDEREAALESYRQALELFRAVGDRLGEAYTLKAIGDLAVDEEKYDLARSLFEQALLLFETLDLPARQAGVFNSIANIYEKQKDYQTAIQIYSQALERHASAYILRNRALQYIHLKNLDRADEDIKSAELLEPEHPYLFLRKGQLALLRGQYAEAVPLLQSAIKRFPWLSEAYFSLGITDLHLGNPAEALEEYRRGLEFVSKSEELEDALQELEELQTEKPDLPGVDEALALLRNW